jgi:hypothetical protein
VGLIDLQDRALEVHRDPVPADGGQPAYRTVLRFGSDEQVAPLARPDHPLAVADLLP